MIEMSVYFVEEKRSSKRPISLNLSSKFAAMTDLVPLCDFTQDWLSQHAPTKKAKILQRIRALRSEKLNDARFGVRMQGEGVFADHIAALFTLACRKAGLQRRDFPLSTAAFRRPTGAQLSLFS